MKKWLFCSLVVVTLISTSALPSQAYIREIEWSPEAPDNGDRVTLTMHGVFGEGGFEWTRRDVERAGGEMQIELVVEFGEICPQMVTDYRLNFDCGELPGGVYDLAVHLTVNRLHDRAVELQDEQWYHYQLEVNGAAERRVGLVRGWNFMALPVDPADQDIRSVFRTLAEQGHVRMVRDSHGRFYRPDANFNNIPQFDPLQGYQVFATEDCELSMTGVPVEPDASIALDDGWNLIAYLPEAEQNAENGFGNIAEQLLLVKDAHGHFYSPPVGYSNMPELEYGQAYQVKTRQAVELVWRQP